MTLIGYKSGNKQTVARNEDPKPAFVCDSCSGGGKKKQKKAPWKI